MAMGAVIVVMIVAMFIMVAIAVVTMSGSDRARDAKDRAMGNEPIDAAVAAYQQALSTGAVSEATGFVFTKEALTRYVASAPGGTRLLADSSPEVTNSHMDKIDGTFIPANERYTVATPLQASNLNGDWSFWQMYSLVPPTFGVTPGGATIAYFRGWVGAASGQGATKPVYVRTQFRGPTFSDYEIVADGKIILGPGAKINGRVHSNGFNSSIGNQLRGYEQITLLPGAQCLPTAKISTASGNIDDHAGSCTAAQQRQGTHEIVNLLRVSNSVAQIRSDLCGTYAGNVAYQHVAVKCFNRPSAADTRPYWVRLSGTSACVNASGSGGFGGCAGYSALNTGANGKLGRVLIFDHDVNVTGSLSARGRLTIMTAARAQGGAMLQTSSPTIYLRGSGSTTVGSSGGTSSVGLVAEGDVIADESTACPLKVRAAVIAQSGTFTFRKPWSEPFQTAGGVLCPAPGASPAFELLGSVSSHYMVAMANALNHAGFESRSYNYDPDLYENPPPLMTRTGDWQLERYSDANLSCFNASTGALANPLPAGC